MVKKCRGKLFVAPAVLIVTAVACNSQFPFGGSSAALEILPDSVTLEVDEVGDETANAAKLKNDARCTGDPALDRTLRAGALVIHSFHRLADRSLALGARLRLDLVDPEQTQVEGTFHVLSGPVAYKADFAAFDFDGDGTSDGSGHAGVEPVALRVWVDPGTGFERFLCALVTTPPSMANLGAGEMYVHPGAANTDLSPDLAVYAKWDRTDDAHKWNEAFVSGRVRPDMLVAMGHHRVDVRTNTGGEVEKTIRSATVFNEHPLGFENYQFAAHFLRGGGHVLLSGMSTGGTMQVNFANVCVDLAGCSVDVTGGCDGFDTQDMTFIDAPAGGEADFPADFPTTPTF